MGKVRMLCTADKSTSSNRIYDLELLCGARGAAGTDRGITGRLWRGKGEINRTERPQATSWGARLKWAAFVAVVGTLVAAVVHQGRRRDNYVA